jgi:hypothetical protein
MLGSEPEAASVEAQLDELQRQSEQRRQELREIAAALPAVVSRRAMLRTMAVDLWHAPSKGGIVSGALRTAARAPLDAYRAVRHWTRQRTR